MACLKLPLSLSLQETTSPPNLRLIECAFHQVKHILTFFLFRPILPFHWNCLHLLFFTQMFLSTVLPFFLRFFSPLLPSILVHNKPGKCSAVYFILSLSNSLRLSPSARVTSLSFLCSGWLLICSTLLLQPESALYSKIRMRRNRTCTQCPQYHRKRERERERERE